LTSLFSVEVYGVAVSISFTVYGKFAVENSNWAKC